VRQRAGAQRPASAPELTTARLALRAPRASDADAIAAAGGDRRVSRQLLHVPHPYPVSVARAWIAQARRDGHAWVVTQDGGVIGVVSLRVNARHHHAELGYWLAHRAWGRGLATEACRAVVAHAFGALRLERVWAQTLGPHAASARVLAKLGMTREGVRRRHLRKAGRYHDAHLWAVLRGE
jgi:RimJ/RimL family protein N-acetyltransferase